jgi:UDP:flavonoid glycosyltransferase YjiC (YdhE family)
MLFTLPAIATVRRRVPVRPEQAEAAWAGSAPDWLDSLPARPTVHLSFGTIWNQDRSLFRTALDALAARPVNVVVALGPGRNPAALGRQPANVHVRGFIPYAQLLGHCDVVVCHGGAGSVLGALTDGTPASPAAGSRLVLQRGAGRRGAAAA